MLVYLQMIESPEDQVKFEDIYRKYRSVMYYAANAILKNRQDAEDAVHNAFLSLAKNIAKVSDLNSAKTYGFLITITEHKAIDLLRRRKKVVQGEWIDEAPGGLFPDAYEHDLKWCIDQLPARYREIILLKYSHGYSTREIAEILGISFDAASKLDQRAKKRLESLCRKEEIL